jgi:hypothetical protein
MFTHSNTTTTTTTTTAIAAAADFLIASGVGLSLLYCGHFWPIVQAPDDR